MKSKEGRGWRVMSDWGRQSVVTDVGLQSETNRETSG